MNRIDDERVKFFFEHEARIREWANLETEVFEFVDRFFRSLKSDLDAALIDGRIADDGVESFLHEGRLGLRRQGWPRGEQRVDVRLGWDRKRGFPPLPRGWVACGAFGEGLEVALQKEAHPAFPNHFRPWAAYKHLDPPTDRFWEGDNLKEYRRYVVDTILEAWQDLAPLVDRAVGHGSS